MRSILEYCFKNYILPIYVVYMCYSRSEMVLWILHDQMLHQADSERHALKLRVRAGTGSMYYTCIYVCTSMLFSLYQSIL